MRWHGWPVGWAAPPCICDSRRFFRELAIAKGDGRYGRVLRGLAKTDLVVLDDWGLAPLQLTSIAAICWNSSTIGMDGGPLS